MLPSNDLPSLFLLLFTNVAENSFVDFSFTILLLFRTPTLQATKLHGIRLSELLIILCLEKQAHTPPKLS